MATITVRTLLLVGLLATAVRAARPKNAYEEDAAFSYSSQAGVSNSEVNGQASDHSLGAKAGALVETNRTSDKQAPDYDECVELAKKLMEQPWAIKKTFQEGLAAIKPLADDPTDDEWDVIEAALKELVTSSAGVASLLDNIVKMARKSTTEPAPKIEKSTTLPITAQKILFDYISMFHVDIQPDTTDDGEDHPDIVTVVEDGLLTKPMSTIIQNTRKAIRLARTEKKYATMFADFFTSRDISKDDLDSLPYGSGTSPMTLLNVVMDPIMFMRADLTTESGTSLKRFLEFCTPVDDPYRFDENDGQDLINQKRQERAPRSANPLQCRGIVRLNDKAEQ